MYPPVAHLLLWADVWEFPGWCELTGLEHTPIQDHPDLLPLSTALRNCSTPNEAAQLSSSIPPELKAAQQKWSKLWTGIASKCLIWKIVEDEMSDRGVDVPHACRAFGTGLPKRPASVYASIIPHVATKLFGASAFMPRSTILHNKVLTVTTGLLYHCWNKQMSALRRLRSTFAETAQKADQAWAGKHT